MRHADYGSNQSGFRSGHPSLGLRRAGVPLRRFETVLSHSNKFRSTRRVEYRECALPFSQLAAHLRGAHAGENQGWGSLIAKVGHGVCHPHVVHGPPGLLLPYAPLPAEKGDLGQERLFPKARSYLDTPTPAPTERSDTFLHFPWLGRMRRHLQAVTAWAGSLDSYQRKGQLTDARWLRK